MAAAAPTRRSSPLGQGARILVALITLMWVSEIVDTLATAWTSTGSSPATPRGWPE